MLPTAVLEEVEVLARFTAGAAGGAGACTEASACEPAGSPSSLEELEDDDADVEDLELEEERCEQRPDAALDMAAKEALLSDLSGTSDELAASEWDSEAALVARFRCRGRRVRCVCTGLAPASMSSSSIPTTANCPNLFATVASISQSSTNQEVSIKASRLEVGNLSNDLWLSKPSSCGRAEHLWAA